jgi:Tfp pilus assembly protein PilF
LAPTAASAHLQLGLLYESTGEVANAIERYRQVLKTQPNNAAALNNLAYNLAVRLNAPEEALPYARRAVARDPNNALTIDTLAWTLHLLGQHAAAAKLLRPIAQKSTGKAEIHLHAAVVYAAAGEPTISKAQLAEALRLDPALASTDEVKALRARLASNDR